MKYWDKIKMFIVSPRVRFEYFSKLGFLNWMDDEKYLRKEYYYEFGRELDLDNPKTFNEKLQWLKLYDRKDIYITMADKHKVKEYVARIIGEEYIIPTLGVYDNFDDIDFGKLPNQFVMKCTHDSGGIIICSDKAKFDKKIAKRMINRLLKRNYYYLHREWSYKDVKPRIIIEKYMEDKNGKALRDYKFFCFNGKPEILYTSDGSHSEHQKIAFFNTTFTQLPIKRRDYEDYDVVPEKPKNFNNMVMLAKKLSKGIPHVRVDFYDIDGQIYFGEFTLYTCAGMIPFLDEEWDRKLGELIDLDLVEVEE